MTLKSSHETAAQPTRVERLQLGPMANFVYVLVPAGSQRLAIVDPAWDPEALLARADALQRPVTDIILTHHHPDHRNAVEVLLASHPARIHVNKAELPWLAGLGWGTDVVPHDAGDLIDLGGGSDLQLLHTPGHTPGSQCVLVGEHLLTGDTLFIDGCGRCDLPGGDAAVMFQTLYATLANVPGRVRVLPGHDYAPIPEASLDDQRKSNPYLQFQTMADFVAWRMRPRA